MRAFPSLSGERDRARVMKERGREGRRDGGREDRRRRASLR